MKKNEAIEKIADIIRSVACILGEGTIEITSASRIWITWKNVHLCDGRYYDGMSFVITRKVDLMKECLKLKKRLLWSTEIIDHRTHLDVQGE